MSENEGFNQATNIYFEIQRRKQEKDFEIMLNFESGSCEPVISKETFEYEKIMLLKVFDSFLEEFLKYLSLGEKLSVDDVNTFNAIMDKAKSKFKLSERQDMLVEKMFDIFYNEFKAIKNFDQARKRVFDVLANNQMIQVLHRVDSDNNIIETIDSYGEVIE